MKVQDTRRRHLLLLATQASRLPVAVVTAEVRRLAPDTAGRLTLWAQLTQALRAADVDELAALAAVVDPLLVQLVPDAPAGLAVLARDAVPVVAR
ncbi:hypothetical protein MXD62_16585 [Frankia sp. Mgl5]|uniref:hypothetical protein n=1 Tax=Frankia sp. Mgl5 TaxID=2933793 RepID=UPI00200DB1A6|nr:hypothetical protein [Frankia sp. Mgl5]MCK9928773.1 hypothetical protein [Frankia sp. Mgl5]